MKNISDSTSGKGAAGENLDRWTRCVRWLSRWRYRGYRFLGPPRRERVFSAGPTLGRQTEIRRLQENLDKRVNTLLIGPVGVGKSHLLERLQGDRIIQVEGLRGKQPLLQIAAALYNQGALSPTSSPPSQPALEDESAALPEDIPPQAETARAEDFDAFRKQHARTDIPGWIRLILNAVEKDAWTLVVDDLSHLPPSVGKRIDQLREKFVILQQSGLSCEISMDFLC